MHRRSFALLALAALGVAPAFAQPSASQLAPPTPRDVRVHIKQEQNGQRVEVGVEQRFAIELVGVPTAGYLWTPVEMPAFLTRAGEASGATSPEQRQPGFTGGNHWEVLMFAALEAGAGELVLAQKRPWESEAVNVFRVTIVAR